MGCHALLQGIFPIQGSNSNFLHCRQLLYHRNHQGGFMEPEKQTILRTYSSKILRGATGCKVSLWAEFDLDGWVPTNIMSDLLLHTLRASSSLIPPLVDTLLPPPWSSKYQTTSRKKQSSHFCKLPHLDIPCHGCSWDEQLTMFTQGWILDYDLCIATVLACLRDFMKSQPVLCLGLLLLCTYASSSDIGLDIIAWTLRSFTFLQWPCHRPQGF